MKNELDIFQSLLKSDLKKFRSDLLRAIYITSVINLIAIISAAITIILVLKK